MRNGYIFVNGVRAGRALPALAMSSRENQAYGPYGAYTVDEVARRHGASVEEEVQELGRRVRSRSEVAAGAVSRGLAPRLVDGLSRCSRDQRQDRDLLAHPS